MSNIFPPALVRSLKKEFNFEEKSFFETHEHQEQITSVRINPRKSASIYTNEEHVPWCPTGRYLKERPSFISDPYFHAGCYYVQEASSMFLSHILKSQINLEDKLTVLDLCAAPGGKSTLISSLLNEEGLLVSNEIIKTRVNVLADNLTKWGPSNVVVTNNDPKDFAKVPALFDVMVIDAPCSGSGMFRKDPEAISEWSESAVVLCSQRQQRILADSFPALKKGGLLIYSTCSYSIEENENIADWLCDTFDLTPVEVPIQNEWGIVETCSSRHQVPGYRFYPHKLKGEGFFVACFIKNEGDESFNPGKTKLELASKAEELTVSKWLNHGADLNLVKFNGEILAFPKNLFEEFKALHSKLYIKKAGTRLGRIAGKDLVPDHELAMSLLVHPDIPKINLTKEEALTYLKKEDIKLETAITGWVLICYDNFPLGWAKVLPNRVNNYFPKELRILKDLKDL
ncbi:MAG TPA: RNA methyltransferase [Sphingobacteriaceae bacterium]